MVAVNNLFAEVSSSYDTCAGSVVMCDQPFIFVSVSPVLTCPDVVSWNYEMRFLTQLAKLSIDHSIDRTRRLRVSLHVKSKAVSTTR